MIRNVPWLAISLVCSASALAQETPEEAPEEAPLAVPLEATTTEAPPPAPPPPPVQAPPPVAPAPRPLAQPAAAPPPAPAPQYAYPIQQQQPVAYRRGMTIPEGYMVKTERRPGLYVTGAALLGSTYIISTLSATIAMEDGDQGIWPLYIPVVGPFITLATMDNRTPTGAYFLVLDGLAQAAGVGMLAGGLAGKSWIVPIPRVAYDPDIGQAEAGLQMVGRF